MEMYLRVPEALTHFRLDYFHWKDPPWIATAYIQPNWFSGEGLDIERALLQLEYHVQTGKTYGPKQSAIIPVPRNETLEKLDLSNLNL